MTHQFLDSLRIYHISKELFSYIQPHQIDNIDKHQIQDRYQ